MKKHLLLLLSAACGFSVFAAPVSQASKDWVRREIAAAISAAGKATVVENADGTRTCLSPFTSDTITNAVSIALTFSPVRVVRHGATTFNMRRFAAPRAGGEEAPDVIITITSGYYVTKNLDNAGVPIAVDFDFGSGLELILQDEKLPDLPNCNHTCEINSECFCIGYGKAASDFSEEAKNIYYDVNKDDFEANYCCYDWWIDLDSWPDVTENPKTKEKRYWVTDVNDSRIALDQIDDTIAWKEGLSETLKDINSWMEECREAHCNSRVCDKENPQHLWGEWRITKTTTKIIYLRTCQRCGVEERREVDIDTDEPELPAEISCTSSNHIPKPSGCGCICGEYGPGKPHGSTSFHHFGAARCLCDCEYLHRDVESSKCPGICNFCARPAKAGVAAAIAKAPASMHTVCSIADNRCGCKCGIVTHEIDDSDFHIFKNGECRCLGAAGEGGKWHRHMPKSGCEGICNGSSSWGYDGLHKVAAGDKVAAKPIAARPDDHTQAIGNRCGCECGEYTTSNIDDWKTIAALHKSNPADCGCYCDHAKESMLDDFHKYASADDCLCHCEKEHTFKKGACESVCFGANHGSKYIAGWYGYQNPDAKNYHTPKTNACGCVCGEFTGEDYDSLKHHNGTGTPSCRCECGRKHTPTEGNPCVELCNTCKLLATSGIVESSKLAPKDENHTFPADAEYCGCACGAVTTPHKCAPGECYCYGHYAAGSTDDHNGGEPVLVKHIGIAATGNIVTNEKSCASCSTPYEQYANEFKCANDHIVLGDFIGGKNCNHRGGCARNCDCCDHNETICECPWCNRVVGAVDYCTCAGSSRDRVWVLSGAKINSASILPLGAYLSTAPIIEIIGDSSVREIEGDAFNSIHSWEWPDTDKNVDFSKLKSVQFNSVEKVGGYGFYRAFPSPLLETLELNRVGHIGDYGLSAVAPNIKRFNLPLLKTAGTCIFGDNPNLEEVILPELLEMGSTAFSGCSNLRRVYAPKANMGYGAFSGCTKLEEVDISAWSTNGLFLGENDAPYNPLELPSGCRVKCEEGWITVP